MKDLNELLKDLNFNEKKIVEISKKTNIIENIQLVDSYGYKLNKLQYALCSIIPKSMDLKKLSTLINNGLIKHEGILKGLIKNKIFNEEDALKFIKENEFDFAEIKNFIKAKKDKNIKATAILKETKEAMPYIDFKIVLDELKDYHPIIVEDGNESKGSKRKDWLEEGELGKLKTPAENKQANERILREHLDRTKGVVVTRFPPEPNGKLHIGHVKALNISFNYAKKYGGYTYLRFDDTNPRNEKDVFYDEIIKDVRWLGFEPIAITASSDHFEKMIEMSKKLIMKDKAYICFLSNDELKKRRALYQKSRDSGFDSPEILSPYRNSTPEVNIKHFQDMAAGKYEEGKASLRFKMDLESKNPLMLDLVGCRIIDLDHPRKKKNYLVYPTYEFALCVADSLEDVTHSFCSREFYTRQEPYHWLLRELDLYEPIQWEFSRLNVSNTILSKRKLTKLVSMGLSWDDPRFYTVAGMRRRGFPPNAINEFVKNVGVTFSETIIDIKLLENFVFKELYATSEKIFCITNPLKININLNKKRHLISNRSAFFKSKNAQGDMADLSSSDEGVEVDINNCIYIDGSDFEESGNKNFLRLTPTNPVGLIGLGSIKFIKKGENEIFCEFISVDDEAFVKPSKFIQWLPNLQNNVELRNYSSLFNDFDPEGGDGFLVNANIEGSLVKEVGYCDNRILKTKISKKYQFIRKGFYCCDDDSDIENKKLIFNLTLGLKVPTFNN